ncbi:MAG: hypothetical protein NVSMB25_04820 [Thermoleophilaceae bacterium]
MLLSKALPAGAQGSTQADQRQRRLEELLSAVAALELTAVKTYEVILAARITDRRTARTLMRFRDDEHAHGRAISDALAAMGASRVATPKRADIAGLEAATTDAAVLDFAITLEERTVGAYSATVRQLAHRPLLRTLAGALANDAQQLVILRKLAGREPVPGAFDSGTSAP